VEYEAMFFHNGDVREEFVVDDYYVGPARNRPPTSFRVAIDCYEGYMVLVRSSYVLEIRNTLNRFGW
jgi:hypothetical protein